MLRHADPAHDGAACAAIYAPYVAASAVSFEELAPDGDEMARRIVAIGATHPWLVAETDGQLTGYAYASPHRARAAYRWAADVSIYVSGAHQGRGTGRALYSALLNLLRAQRLLHACAGITLPNPASVALHEALGFRCVGVYRNIGYKQDRWRDVGWWQLELVADPPVPPPEPTRPQRLSEAHQR